LRPEKLSAATKKFPVRAIREFSAKGHEFSGFFRKRYPGMGSKAKISLYFPVEQGIDTESGSQQTTSTARFEMAIIGP
jgi:hypothetical protein